jgi:L-rhamnose mutarotase
VVKRQAFMLQLKPGSLKDYKYHHDHIWPDLVEEIRKSGIAKITIFERDPTMFLYSEIYDENAWDKLWHSETHDRWGAVMEPLMEFGDDGIVKSWPMNEVFNLDVSVTSKG